MDPAPFQGEGKPAQAAEQEQHPGLELRLRRRGRSMGQYFDKIYRADLVLRAVKFRGTTLLS